MQPNDGVWYQRPNGTLRFKIIDYGRNSREFRVKYENGEEYYWPSRLIVPCFDEALRICALEAGDKVVFLHEGEVYVSRFTGERIEGVVTSVKSSSFGDTVYRVDFGQSGHLLQVRSRLLKVSSTPTKKEKKGKTNLTSFLSQVEKDYA